MPCHHPPSVHTPSARCMDDGPHTWSPDCPFLLLWVLRFALVTALFRRTRPPRTAARLPPVAQNPPRRQFFGTDGTAPAPHAPGVVRTITCTTLIPSLPLSCFARTTHARTAQRAAAACQTFMRTCSLFSGYYTLCLEPPACTRTPAAARLFPVASARTWLLLLLRALVFVLRTPDFVVPEPDLFRHTPLHTPPGGRTETETTTTTPTPATTTCQNLPLQTVTHVPSVPVFIIHTRWCLRWLGGGLVVVGEGASPRPGVSHCLFLPPDQAWWTDRPEPDEPRSIPFLPPACTCTCNTCLPACTCTCTAGLPGTCTCRPPTC